MGCQTVQEATGPRTRYVMPYRVTMRFGEYEAAMLESLAAMWNCNRSEAIRRSIVYTFCKIVAGLNKFDEKSITSAVELALNIYEDVKKKKLAAEKAGRKKRNSIK